MNKIEKLLREKSRSIFELHNAMKGKVAVALEDYRWIRLVDALEILRKERK